MSLREAHTSRCLSDQGCQRHVRAVLPHEGFVPFENRPCLQTIQPFSSMLYFSRDTWVHSQYLRTHVRGAAFLSNSFVGIEHTPRWVPNVAERVRP